MAKFSTTKPNIDFTRKEYGRTLITTIYTMISTWNNATNWTLTIPRDGRYKITASGNMLALESSTAGNIVCYCRLARDGVAITGTARSVGISINAATYAYNQSPFEITWEDTFIAGEVITLQAAYLAGSGNECRIDYAAGAIEPFMSYEMINAYVSTIDKTVGAWNSFVMTIGATSSAPTKGTMVIDNAQWRKVGANMEIMYSYQQSAIGVAGTGTYLFPIPGGYSVDTSKIPGVADGNISTGVCGSCSCYNGSAAYPGNVKVYNATNLCLDYSAPSVAVSSGGMNLGTANSMLFSFMASVPIVGWS